MSSARKPKQTLSFDDDDEHNGDDFGDFQIKSFAELDPKRKSKKKPKTPSTPSDQSQSTPILSELSNTITFIDENNGNPVKPPQQIEQSSQPSPQPTQPSTNPTIASKTDIDTDTAPKSRKLALTSKFQKRSGLGDPLKRANLSLKSLDFSTIAENIINTTEIQVLNMEKRQLEKEQEELANEIKLLDGGKKVVDFEDNDQNNDQNNSEKRQDSEKRPFKVDQEGETSNLGRERDRNYKDSLM
jgi:hypothetical protein